MEHGQVDRRTFIGESLISGGAALVGGRSALAVSARKPAMTPTAYHMPLETGPHARTFMQWPVNPAVYDDDELAGVQDRIALIANTIVRFEPVVLLTGEVEAEAARTLVHDDVEIWHIPTDDLWCRDSGPTFVKNAAGNLAVAHLRFNGWGNKQVHTQDARISERIAARLGIPLLGTGLVGEGGGVEHDGAGTLLATASCWVNRNRNKDTQDQIGAKLLAALGGKKLIWVPGVKGRDITDYHIDALARFVGPGKVLIQLPDKVFAGDPFSRAAFEAYEILKRQTDAQGRKLDIIVIPEAINIRSRKDDFLASYVNYYVCNDAVIGAQFGDDRTDQKAHDMLAQLYPDREIVMLDIDPIGEAGGGIHCATQQQPAAESSKA
jgi:agmatine deiminase